MKKNKKKNLVRIVAALLVAMLALTLIPMGAFAAEAKDGKKVTVYKEYTEVNNPTFADTFLMVDPYDTGTTYEPGSVIKTSDYNSPIIISGELYDFFGFENNQKISDKLDKVSNFEEFEKLLKSEVPFTNSNISIPKDLDSKDGQKWYDIWNVIFACYTPHKHKLSAWYSDGTTHWRECLVCKKYPEFYDKFMYQNWCQDGDEDGICNVCGGDVPYHDITVIESEGGKITLNRDNASHRTKITADVEVEEGYKLKKLHFVKVREDGSKQEITRHKKDGQFWTLMPTYEMEVSAEFIKK